VSQISSQTVAENVTADPACFDEEAGCPAWAQGDGCIQTGPAFMLDKCRRSCGVCGRPYVRRSVSKVGIYSLHACRLVCKMYCDPDHCMTPGWIIWRNQSDPPEISSRYHKLGE